MVQNKNIPTIDLRVPTSWEDLTDNQLRYVFGLISQSLSATEVKTYCFFHWSGMQLLHKYGKGWMCKFVDDEFVVTAEQVNAAIVSLKWLDKLPAMPIRIKKIGRHHALPADFQEVPFETFIICDNLYQGYLATKQDKLLANMAAFLYDFNDVGFVSVYRNGDIEDMDELRLHHVDHLVRDQHGVVPEFDGEASILLASTNF